MENKEKDEAEVVENTEALNTEEVKEAEAQDNVEAQENTDENVKLVYVDTREKADIPNVVVTQAPKPEEDNKSTGKKVLDFFITTLNGMAIGLFATLIIGTIIQTIGGFFKNGDNAFCQFMYDILAATVKDEKNMAIRFGAGPLLQNITGAGIGVGVALALKKKPLEVVVLGAAGQIAAMFSLSTTFVTKGILNNTAQFQIGDPLTIYLVVISVALAMKYVLRKKTPVDILIVPLFGIAVALTVGLLVRFPAIYVTYGVQYIVSVSTNAVPFVMGIVIAVLMGMALTAPISSAAIGAMVLSLPTGMSVTEALANSDYRGLVIASGAAIVGCCCQMVGFAVQSRKDNNIGMVISIGIGTSMLQFKNIMKKPIIWLPTIIASAILGPVSTCWLELACTGSNAGMGTAGLVGQIGTISSMGADKWQTWVGIFGLQIIAPAIIVFGLDILFRRFNLYKEGDLKV